MLFLRALEHRLSSPIPCYAFKLGLIYKLDSALSPSYGEKMSHFYFGQMKGTLEMVFVILFDIHIYIFEVCCQKPVCLPFFFISLWKRNCQNLCLCLLCVCVCLCVYDCCSSYRNICCGPYTFCRVGFNGCRYSGIMNYFMWGLFPMRCYLFHLGSLFICIPLPPFLQGSISYNLYCTCHQY